MLIRTSIRNRLSPLASFLLIISLFACGDVNLSVGISAPVINSIDPSSGAPGIKITINGSGFGPSQGSSIVSIGGINAGIALSWSNTTITIRVPTSLSPGDKMVKVVVDSRESNQLTFKVTRYILITNSNSNDLTVFDTESMIQIPSSPFPIGNGINSPRGICFDINKNRIYIANTASNNLSILDGSTFTPIGSSPILTGGLSPYDVAYDPDRNRIYIVNKVSNSISAFDAETLTKLSWSPKTLDGSGPVSIAYDGINKRIYIVNENSNNMSVLSTAVDPPSFVSGSPFPAGNSPSHVLYIPSKNIIVISNRGSNNITVYDASTLIQLPNSPYYAGSSPAAAEYDQDNNRIYITNSSADLLTVLDASTFSQIPGTPVSVGNGPEGILYLSSKQHIYIVNSNSNNFSVLKASDFSQITGSPFTAGTTPSKIILEK